MFTHKLNQAQQSVLLGFVLQLIKIDGEFHENEETIFQALKNECNEGLEAKMLPIESLPEVFAFSDEEAKVSLLLELILIALADGVLHHKEKSLIEAIATVLRIQYLLDEAYQWVIDYYLIFSRAEALMNPTHEDLRAGWNALKDRVADLKDITDRL